jgi:uncharacterized protein
MMVDRPHVGKGRPFSHMVGVISDTHGLIRPEAIAALRGSDLIIHAGDVGRPGVIDALRAVAPTYAVRGNIDEGDWAAGLPQTQRLEIGGLGFLVLHDLSELDLDDPAAARIAAVVSGHSHKPSATTRDGILFLNPGSAGPRRFSLPVTVGEIVIRRGTLTGRIIGLSV